MSIQNICSAICCLAIFSGTAVMARATSILVSVNPVQFSGATDGPYYLDLTLTGTADTTVDAIANFTGPVGAPVPTGDASGSLSSSVVLSDGPLSFFNDFYQEFTPGHIIGFTIDTTIIDSATPDTLTLSLLDSSLLPIPTLDPSGANTLFTIDLGSAPTFFSYASDISQSNSDIVYPVVSAPVLTVASVAPEAPTAAYALLGAFAAWLLIARRRLIAAPVVIFSALSAASAPAQICQPIYQPSGSPISLVAGREAAGLALADFDGDGVPDMAVVTASTATLPSVLVVLKGNLAGGFSPFGGSPITLSNILMNGGNGVSVVAADFNQDGKMDLAVASDKGSVFVLTGNGNGAFNVPGSAVFSLPFTAGAAATLAAADLNGDSYPDLVAGTGGHVFIMLNSHGTLAILQSLSDRSAFVGDLNGDGYPDLIGSSSGFIYLNNRHGSFTQSSTTISLPPYANGSSGMGTIGDFNGDGRADLLFVAQTSNGTSIEYQLFYGDGIGNFTAGAIVQTGISLAGTAPNNSLAAGDFNGDGRLDFAFSAGTTTQTNSLYVFEGASGGGFAQPVGSPFPLGDNSLSQQVAARDLNADGRPDIVASSVNGGNGEVFVFLANSRKATIGMTTSANPGITGSALTLIAVVGASGCAAPTGEVVFTVDGGSPNPAVLSNGQAVLTLTSGLSAGVHNIAATYSGDGNFQSSSVGFVEFVGSSTCSPNLTGQVTIKPGGFVFDRGHQQFVQTVSVTNNGPGAITGPVSLALDAMSSNATLASPSGYTSCATPANSPLADLGICPGSPLAAGGTVSVILRFNDPALTAIAYTPRVLGGLTPR